MESTSSLSKGCFAFRPKSSNKKKRSHKDEFEEFNLNPQFRMYSSIIKGIEKRLKEINNSASDQVLQELIQYVSACGSSDFAVPTAVLLTGINLPDHHELFDSLTERLKEEVTPHVSVLLSSECSTVKNTIEQLTSQFLKHSTHSKMDVDDYSDSEEDDEFDDVKRSQCTMPNLAAWYESLEEHSSSPKEHNKVPSHGKLVVIFPDFEGFCSKVVQDVIIILSGYLDRLPIVLVFGVATSVKALQSNLPHRVTSRMDVQMFQSRPSVHFLNNTVNEVFLSYKNKSICPFILGPKMFKFLTDVFIFYDFSVHGFIQGIKYCLMEHFYSNPLSRLCCPRKQLAKVISDLSEEEMNHVEENTLVRKYLESLPPKKAAKIIENNQSFKDAILGLMEDLQDRKHCLVVATWLLHSLVQDLPEAPLGKQVREVFIEVISKPIAEHPKFDQCFKLLHLMSKQEILQKIDEVINLIVESRCLEDVHEKLIELKKDIMNAGQSTKSPSQSPSKRRPMEVCSDRKRFREQLLEKNVRVENEFEQARSKLLAYLKTEVFEKYLISLSSLPFHEVVVIDNPSAKRHIVGAPRAALHTALNNPQHYLRCDCCEISSGGEILSTMPDICIAYKLHLESGALINMYDWLQSFVTIVSPEDAERDERNVDPALQARFTRAVSELQFMGFIKASKKKTDHATRLTWGGTS